jgi:hypothetical protein
MLTPKATAIFERLAMEGAVKPFSILEIKAFEKPVLDASHS